MSAARPAARIVLALALLAFLTLPRAWSDTADDSTVVAAWDAHGGVLQPDASVAVPRGRRPTYDEVETYVWQVIPPELHSRFARLELFTVPETSSDSTDGTVVETDDGSAWILSLDEQEGEDAVLGGAHDDQEVFDTAVVHELGHVLSLSPDQMTADTTVQTYPVDEGTLRPDSWLNVFYVQFWKDKYPGWKDSEDPGQADALYRAPASING